jgi:hypothetical protein
MKALGINTAPMGDIETLSDRMLQEATEVRGVVFSPPLIGAFARKAACADAPVEVILR